MKDKATKIKSINKKIIWRLSVFAFIVFYFISLCGGILHLFHALTLLYRILLFFWKTIMLLTCGCFYIRRLIERMGK